MLESLTRQALERKAEGVGLIAPHRLFDDDERAKLAGSLAAVLALADLMGRARVRELAEKAAGSAETFSDAEPLKVFAEKPPGVIAAPEAALEYLRGLVPTLGIDPERWGQSLRRKAFTLAAATDETLAAKVRTAIADAIEEGKSHQRAAADIDGLLDAAGVSARNQSYSEMVWRSNCSDAFLTAAQEEYQQPDVMDAMPVWQYVGIRDGRQGKDHEPHFDRYYPASVAFAEVRGPRVFNCRCNFIPLTRGQWQKLQDQGARLEES